MTAPAGWYPGPEGQERYWDGTGWTTAFRPTPVAQEDQEAASSAGTNGWFGWKGLNSTGRFVRLTALGVLAGGLYVGYGMHVQDIGFTAVDPDHPTLEELQGTHTVDCGTAFNQQFSSVNCGKALDGHKTAAVVLLISGAALGLGAGVFKTSDRPG